MSFTANAKPVDKQSVYELRSSISQLMQGDFTGRLTELEFIFKQLVQELEKKESAPPRSDFWDLRVIIAKENQSKYNRVNNTEAVAGIWQALKLEHVGDPDHMKLACRTGDEYGSCHVVHLADFELDKFPASMRTMCNNFFNGVSKFEFFVQTKRNEQDTCDTTEKAEMMTALCKVHSAIVEIEHTRLQLKQKMDKYTKQLKDVLKNELYTLADSDAEESDESDASEHDDGSAQDRPLKRRKTFDEMGSSKDTDQQNISLVGIELSPGASVESLRIREFRGSPEPHFVDLMGAFSTDKQAIISKRIPYPRAPTYSHGAAANNEWCNFQLDAPGIDINSDTCVTHKMMDIDREKDSNLVGEYEIMHRLAHALRTKISDLVKLINNDLEFVVRVHTSNGQSTDRHVNNLTLMQKYAIGSLYLYSIAVNNDKPDEKDIEEEDEEEQDAEEEQDDDDCSVYESESSSDDEDYESESSGDESDH